MLSIALLAPLARVAPRRLAWGVLVVCGLLVAALPANAEEPALAAGLVDQVRSLALDKAAAPAAARVEVVVGQLDPRLHLAPCERIEPYLPANVRLWGKSRIGLRCTQGRTAWNVYLPIVVKVWGRALVVPAGATAGSEPLARLDMGLAHRLAGAKGLGEGPADDELAVEKDRGELLGEVDLGFLEVAFGEHAAGRRAGGDDESASPDPDDDRQVDVPRCPALRAAQADAALAPQANVRRQIRLDALARRQVQARIELADDDLDAGCGRCRRLVEGERADLVDEAGGQRRLFPVGRKR